MDINEAIRNAEHWYQFQTFKTTIKAGLFISETETNITKYNREYDNRQSEQYLHMYAFLLVKFGWDQREIRRDRTSFGNLKAVYYAIDLETLEKLANS